MKPRSAEYLIARARRIRDWRNGLMLGFILIAVVAAAVPITQDWFPGIDSGEIFGAAVGIGAIAAQLVYGLLMRNRHPRCPNCGNEWQIMESGSADNRDHFEGHGTSCPHCGTPI